MLDGCSKEGVVKRVGRRKEHFPNFTHKPYNILKGLQDRD